MANELYDLLPTVTDEQSFLRFLAALRSDCETHEQKCQRRSYFECASENHWETHSTKDFLKSMEAWGSGDFGDGEHGGEPMLRRIATMLLVARGLRPEDRP
jgi:hypothetical protein